MAFNDFHIHTNVTDGENTPEEIIGEARRLGIKVIAFTEHIRERASYDWFGFHERIKEIKPKGLKVLVGVEAKVLNAEGKLDVSKDVFDAADIVLGAVHRPETDVVWLLESDCDIIAHPQIDENNVEKFIDCKKALEFNPMYPLESGIIKQIVASKKNMFSFGSNTESLGDMEKGQEYFSKIDKKYKIGKRLVKL